MYEGAGQVCGLLAEGDDVRITVAGEPPGHVGGDDDPRRMGCEGPDCEVRWVVKT